MTPARLWSDMCRNPKCGEWVGVRRWQHAGFCPSCWWQLKAGFSIGAFTAGLILGALNAWLK